LPNFHIFNKLLIIKFISKLNEIFNLFIFILVDLLFSLCPNRLRFLRSWKSRLFNLLLFFFKLLNDLIDILFILKIIVFNFLRSSTNFLIFLFHLLTKLHFF